MLLHIIHFCPSFCLHPSQVGLRREEGIEELFGQLLSEEIEVSKFDFQALLLMYVRRCSSLIIPHHHHHHHWLTHPYHTTIYGDKNIWRKTQGLWGRPYEHFLVITSFLQVVEACRVEHRPIFCIQKITEVSREGTGVTEVGRKGDMLTCLI